MEIHVMSQEALETAVQCVFELRSAMWGVSVPDRRDLVEAFEIIERALSYQKSFSPGPDYQTREINGNSNE